MGVSRFTGATLDDNYLKHTELAWEMTLFLSEDNSTGLNTCPLIPSNLRACKLALRRSCEPTGLSWNNFKANKNRSRKILQSRREKKKSFPQLPPNILTASSGVPPSRTFLGNERVTKPLRLSAWKVSFLNSLPQNKCETEGRRLGVRTVQNDHSAIERTVYIDVVLYSVKPYNFEALCPINTVMCPKEVLELNILSSNYYCLTPGS